MSESLRDAPARRRALDAGLSCIVQAPAGSGKTTLLVGRVLSLLAQASSPEEVLAITFTRKAAAEMRQRVLQRLVEGGDAAAEAARLRDAEMGWRLAEVPARLRIQTIDSYALELSSGMPLESGGDRRADLLEDAAPLHEQAADAVLAELPADALRLLELVDNDARAVRGLLAGMLARRDQWLEAARRVVDARRSGDVQEVLEAGLKQLRSAASENMEHLLHQEVLDDLRWAVAHASAGKGLSEAEVDFWPAAKALCLTGKGEWRRQVTKRDGFPTGSALFKQAKERVLLLLGGLSNESEEVRSRLDAMGHLPAAHLESGQADDVAAVCGALLSAERHLARIMRAERCTDFTQLNLAARTALEKGGAERGLRHVLVDEFQDTSVAQMDMLRRMVEGWRSAPDGPTVFVVGDPMQSIYRFRDADVGIFGQALESGVGGLPLLALRLQSNFRSAPVLVEWQNKVFSRVLGHRSDVLLGAVPHGESIAAAEVDGERPELLVLSSGAAEEDALVERVLRLQRERPEDSVALLVRSRAHLAGVLPKLKAAGVAWRASDIDPLSTSPTVVDLLSLASALDSPWDRLAWLSALRAPWVGLSLPDLERFASVQRFSADELRRIAERLSDEGAARVRRFAAALDRWWGARHELEPRTALESIWLECGGAACGSEAAAHAGALLSLMDDLGAEAWDVEALRRGAERLFAPAVGEAQLRIMTIHKAKGLEFDHVLLPRLDRGTRTSSRPILHWRLQADGGLLMGARDQGGAYDWLQHEDQERTASEMRRLLYVACTRAKRSLLLTGVQPEGSDPSKGSLLSLLWPQVRDGADWAHRNEADDVQQLLGGPPPSSQPPPRLERLANGFQWAPEERPALQVPIVRVRDESEDALADASAGREKERSTAVGTLVHEALQVWAESGGAPADASAWMSGKLADAVAKWRPRLAGWGFDEHQVKEKLACVERLLQAAASDAKGRWLVEDHEDAACEFSVTVQDENRVMRDRRLDRTFMDAKDGVRWVVDYKTSEQQFTAQARRQAEAQVRSYCRAARELWDAPVRGAVYVLDADGAAFHEVALT